MTPEELAGRIADCIRQRMPESDSLDYKAQLNIGTQRERTELAKDVSSFANELGGMVLYGVPETEENGVPVPAALEECGFECESGLPERAENILLDTVRPVLPNLFVKVVTINEKQILVVHHPASWNKPHMVEAYNTRRYFRRGNYRAVPMSEREIEAAYASRRSVQIMAEEFFRTGDLGDIPSGGPFSQGSYIPNV
jgi:predicted HTH transcriptional regulator